MGCGKSRPRSTEYVKAISFIRQTDLRDIIGSMNLLSFYRKGKDSQKIFRRHSIQIPIHGDHMSDSRHQDIIIPQALADAMSKQAQAERERKAR
jgi:regulator of protease activity HflC (stomatin/prohibitin superfamily)